MPYLTHPDKLVDLLPNGEPAFRIKQVRDWLYRTPVLDSEEMTNLPSHVRTLLSDSLWPFQVETDLLSPTDPTRKWLFRTPDGAAIEAVLIGYRDRATLCLSSQSGCALGCTFCATGQFGFDRHLEAGEIVAQVAYAQATLRAGGLPRSPDHLTNVVFMGMGEPLSNYDRVREAIRRIIEEMGFSARSITVSTVGIVPGILRLADEPWPLNLAISLHAADNRLRSRLVPINDRYPLEDVEWAAARYFEKKRRRISIEWTLIDRINDTLDQAEKLAAIATRLRAHVNVIPMNPTPRSSYRPSSPERIRAFVSNLERMRVNVTVRETRGRGIDAACGQLRAQGADPPIGRSVHRSSGSDTRDS